ncbi:MAG: NAD(P)-dependent oxidoreductase [Bacteroidales bacterium]|jgi:nucleoside-diphosphate-sugar epimerase|nr:NAD(P)-dependent oxidoreductase [Bacteroidales bacterium]
MRVLITGATGFVGSNLLPKLVDYDTRIIVRSFTELIDKDRQIILDNDFDKFKKTIQTFVPDVVLNLATYSTSNDDIFSIGNIVESNIFFTSILLESLKNTHIKLFVNTGTFAEYYKNDGKLNPAYYYAASKIAARYIIKYFKNINEFKTVNVIPYTVYGGLPRNKKVIDYIIDSLDSSAPVGMTSGEQILDFIHVDDLCDFYMHCIENNGKLSDGADYHIGTAKGTSIRELAAMIESKTGKCAHIQWGAREYRRPDIMRAVASLESVKELNWTPKIDLDRGLTRLLTEKNIVRR